jgi:hypothetical protein
METIHARIATGNSCLGKSSFFAEIRVSGHPPLRAATFLSLTAITSVQVGLMAYSLMVGTVQKQQRGECFEHSPPSSPNVSKYQQVLKWEYHVGAANALARGA